MRPLQWLSVATLVVVLEGQSAPPTLLDSATRARRDSISADSILERRTSEVAAELRCAVCQGISIQESPSSLAREMRDVVKDQLRAGRTPEEVRAYFVSKYGDWILLAPPPRGLNLVIYVLPVLLVLGGFIRLAVVVRRWSRVVQPGELSTPTDDKSADA
ncbi:MAG: cytochrome c-type biogenesis protein CcmH [Gemmatimonadaceae bacterium]